MRLSFCLAVLASACTLGISSAALAEVTGVNVSASGWDTRTSYYGCRPAGCVPANVLNASTESDSRWSCLASRSQIEVCELTFAFDEPQDIFEMRMAVWKGNRRLRTLDVLVDGVLTTTVQTSGTSLEYEAYELSATQATTIVLREAGDDEDAWLSIMGVQLMTDTEVVVSPSSAAPTSDDYVGCFSDMVGDRVLTAVITDDALTLEDCAATCGELTQYFYGLQQGNECWCAGCDITERDTNTDYDRHGEGLCSTPCAGDPTSTCGGDMAMSLYQTTTCLATPAPTPAVSELSDCPSGSTQASLEVTVYWEDSSSSVGLFVLEPGGVEVQDSFYERHAGDVGMWAQSRDGVFGVDYPGSETYLTLNGLSVADDAVLGEYEIWGGARPGTKWTITARSGGELLLVAGGTLSEFQRETERFTVTVTSYADSDCSIDAYGKCPENTFSPDGVPPCTACPSGLVASPRSTYCTAQALVSLDLPENIATAIVADAVGGFAGAGYLELDGEQRSYQLFVAKGAESGTILVSGDFTRSDGTALPPSTALYLYVHNEDAESDFVRGQGVIDPATGVFAASVTDLPIGFSTAILSFIVLDPADGGDLSAYHTVFGMYAVNEGCSEALRIKLEWDSSDDLDLWVAVPNGEKMSTYKVITHTGYMNTDRIDPFEEYVLFSGLSGDAMLGEYHIFARSEGANSPISCTITATVGGNVVWVEETFIVDTDDDGMYVDDDSSSYYDDDGSYGSSRRHLLTRTDDDSIYYTTSYSATGMPQTDNFIVTLGSYDPVGC